MADQLLTLMNRKTVYTLLAVLLIASILASYVYFEVDPPKTEPLGLYVGVDVAYDNITEIKALVDQVKPYTNLFVIGCTGITYNTTRLNQTCQYLYDDGLDFIVYRDLFLRNATWLQHARSAWGNRFLGYYSYDELGGYQLDMQNLRSVITADNYSDAAKIFHNMTSRFLSRYVQFQNVTQFNLYTSDYGLYWFDYNTGYDTVFAQFGWNYSRQLNIAQCRGAANMHGKDWGAIITWTYTQPPYIESGENLYSDMVLAYENGARYVIVFDSNEGYNASILKSEHLDAMKRFWEYANANPRKAASATDRVAYVLPKDYGYGFRGPNDKIWGLWQADNLTGTVCGDVSKLLTQYGEELDIVYDEGLQANGTSGYSRLVFWNGTVLVP